MLALAVFMLVPTEVFAQVGADAADTGLIGLQERYRLVTEAWMNVIQGYSKALFWSLMTIDMLWLFIKIVLTGSELTRVIAELSKRVIIYGLFLFLIENNGFAPQIIGGFTELAGVMISGSVEPTDSIGDITPAKVMVLGLDTAARIVFDLSIFNFSSAVFNLLAAAIIVLLFAWIAARLMLAFIETYFVSVIGVFMLAFGGLEQSRQLAQKFVFYAISAGVKLFLMLMIVGVAMAIIKQVTAGWLFKTNYEVYIMLGVGLISAVLVNKVPELAQGVINGVSVGNSGGIMSGVAMAAGAAAGVGVAGAAAGSAGAGAAGSAGASGTGAGAGSPAAQALTQSLQAGQAVGSLGASGDSGGGGEAPLPPPAPEQ